MAVDKRKKSRGKQYQPTEEEMKANIWAIMNDYKIVALPIDTSGKEHYVQVKRANKTWKSPINYTEYEAWKEMYRITVEIYKNKTNG